MAASCVLAAIGHLKSNEVEMKTTLIANPCQPVQPYSSLSRRFHRFAPHRRTGAPRLQSSRFCDI